EWIRKNYRNSEDTEKVSQTGMTWCKRVELLKAHSGDVPLSQFRTNEIEDLVRYWQQRPAGKRGKLAVSSVKNVIKQFRPSLRWLNRAREFEWQNPFDLDIPPVRVRRTPAEMSARLKSTQVETYDLDELCFLYEYATPIQRLVILLGLNCGFG